MYHQTSLQMALLGGLAEQLDAVRSSRRLHGGGVDYILNMLWTTDRLPALPSKI